MSYFYYTMFFLKIFLFFIFFFIKRIFSDFFFHVGRIFFQTMFDFFFGAYFFSKGFFISSLFLFFSKGFWFFFFLKFFFFSIFFTKIIITSHRKGDYLRVRSPIVWFIHSGYIFTNDSGSLLPVSPRRSGAKLGRFAWGNPLLLNPLSPWARLRTLS